MSARIAPDRRAAIMLGGAGLAALALPGLVRAAPPPMQVWRSPSCGCCGAWIDHVRAAGLTVEVTQVEDVEPVKDRLGVPAALRSCHTGLIGGHAIEGHVPAAEILRLLAEGPRATGLAVPGMPLGSPGMEMGGRADPYDVVIWGPGGMRVFARYKGGERA
jgi:hypothetical protein